MLFLLPQLAIIIIYFLSAVLPAAFLMRYVYRQDKIEKEPPRLLMMLILYGIAAVALSVAFENIGISILSQLIKPDSLAYTLALPFLVVAVVEEGTKFILLWLRTWREPNFNFRFDGIVYSVFVSLGFAAAENVRYVFSYGLSVALPRGLLSIPGHMSFAVFMGLFYGRAKLFEANGDSRGKKLNLWAAYLTPVLLHGFYNACLMVGNVLSTLIFIGFVIIMYFVIISLIKKEAAADRPI
jgi:RsiW-degrading membrane proteinase PrsW (M82 family)